MEKAMNNIHWINILTFVLPQSDGQAESQYAAARKGRGGVLVLSEFTGASVLLNGAILTNPYSHRRMDEAIEQAISMDIDEQHQRMED